MTFSRVPLWLMVAVTLYLMALVTYSVYSGATIKFFPPEIVPSRLDADAPPPSALKSSEPASPNPTQWRHLAVDQLSKREHWKQDLEQLVNAGKPLREHIFVAVSGSNDIHIWLSPGGGPSWRLRSVDAIDEPNWKAAITDLANHNQIVPIGFGLQDPADSSKLWYLQPEP